MTGFGYDDEGQLSSGYGNTYTFDYEHRLVGIGDTVQFIYDGMGNRLKAIRNGEVKRYVYDAAGNVLAQGGSNHLNRYYIRGLGLLAAVQTNNEVYCYHFNAVGSTIAVTDQNQNVVNKYAYDSFGNVANQVEAVPQPFKFIGQFGVMTEPNGFYYMRARYYDPQVGRFISEDLIGFGSGDVNLYVYVDSVGKPFVPFLNERNFYQYADNVGKPLTETNLYLYTSNNPVNLIDPLGLLPLGSIFSRGSSKGILSGGTYAMTGGIVGGFLGAGLGTLTGIPGMTVVGGTVGSCIGGKIGGLLDPEGAGQLNYGEAKMLQDYYSKNTSRGK
jgi:RHS repeat-associated protein